MGIVESDGFNDRYEKLIALDKMSDGSYLIFEKKEPLKRKIGEKIARVTRLFPSDKDYSPKKEIPYNLIYENYSDKSLVEFLTNSIFESRAEF